MSTTGTGEQSQDRIRLPAPRLLRSEVLVVFAVSLGASGISALLSFLRAVTAPERLSDQRTSITTQFAPGRPWLELLFQLVNVLLALAPVALVIHLLHRSGERLSDIGVDRREPRRDLARGAAIAAVIGAAGLLLYLGAYALGVNRAVVPSNLPATWWRIPVEVLIAGQNGILEEILVAGYLLRRLDQMGWRPSRALALSAVLRGSYHLYQGAGGFVGNLIMGLILGRLYQRWGRVAPLIVAHTLIDAVALVGYTLLAGHLSWLPK
ncbi:MAG TPA: type II CAAX endopeptidase family protein [Frankiaceae bacterium]|nr:type II CAAX endopeptidase family protein [Frankiaceae bacterium]